MAISNTYIVFYALLTAFIGLEGIYLSFSKRSAFTLNNNGIPELRRSAGILLSVISLIYLAYLVICLAMFPDGVIDNAFFTRMSEISFITSPILISPFLMRFLDILSLGRHPWKYAVFSIAFPGLMAAAFIFMDYRPAGYIAFGYIAAMWTVYIIIHVLRQKKVYKALMDNYSNTDKKDIRWIAFIPVLLVLLLAAFAVICIMSTLTWDIVYCCDLFLAAATTFILYHVDRQEAVSISLIAETSGDTKTRPDDELRINFDTIGLALKHKCEDMELFLDPELTREKLAKAIMVNRTYITYYLSHTGQTYNSYINRLRVEYAVRLMEDKDGFQTLKDIAARSGFKTYPSFITAFKEYKGVKPSEYRV